MKIFLKTTMALSALLIYGSSQCAEARSHFSFYLGGPAYVVPQPYYYVDPQPYYYVPPRPYYYVAPQPYYVAPQPQCYQYYDYYGRPYTKCY